MQVAGMWENAPGMDAERVMEQEYQLCGCELLPFALC